jgi:hypothetical protein
MQNLSPPVLSGKTLPCFPCRIDKRPMTPRGFKDATTDIKLIEALWRQYPGSLVGRVLSYAPPAGWPFSKLLPSGAFQP